MPPHRLPGTSCGDPQCLVVISGRSSRRERIIEPEPVLPCEFVSRVRERGRSFVRRHNEVGVIAVMTHHTFGGNHISSDPVVRDIEQTPDEDLVSSPHLVVRWTRRVGGLLDHEPTLCAGRHDDCVLGHLCLHQAENLCAVVLATV